MYHKILENHPMMNRIPAPTKVNGCIKYKQNLQGLSFLKIITCPTSKILKFFDLLIWNKEEKSVQIHFPDW